MVFDRRPRHYEFVVTPASAPPPASSSPESASDTCPCTSPSPEQSAPACPSRHDRAATAAAFRSEIDDPVRRLDDIEIVLDDHNRVALIAQTMQHAEQLFDIEEVQAGRRLVQNIKRAARRSVFGQFLRQLHALRLAA